MNSKTRIGGALLTVSLLFGIGMASSMTAQAQYQNDQYRRDQDPNWRRDRDRDQDRDWRRNRDDDRDWRRNRDDNYDRNRRGRNWDGYPNYGGSFQLRQTALNAGYNEGIKAGRKDRNRNDSYGFRDKSSFRSATKDYNSRLGDRELYRQYFRMAFQTGYNDGLRGY